MPGEPNNEILFVNICLYNKRLNETSLSWLCIERSEK